MADEPDPRAPCTLCGCSCASKRVTEVETSKRAASLLDSDKADDRESLATERARRKLNELHPEAIDFLQPEFSVQRNGEQRFTVSGSFQCKGCRMTARSAPRHQDDRHKSVKVNTSKSRTLDEASEECASKLLQLHRECLPAIHFIQSADHQQSLKLEEVKDEALRRQQELENEARTLQAGCSVRLDINNKKGFEGPDLERHPSNRFAAPRGQQKSHLGNNRAHRLHIRSQARLLRHPVFPERGARFRKMRPNTARKRLPRCTSTPTTQVVTLINFQQLSRQIRLVCDAAQHFKNSKTMHWLSALLLKFAWITKATWSFGCPGHGKGVWYEPPRCRLTLHNNCVDACAGTALGA